MSTETYQTKDMNQIAMLLAMRFHLESIDKAGSVCWFSFRKTTALKEAVDEFKNGSLMINARDMADGFRRAKDLIFDNERV